ncbi:MAG: YraN family protein [Naasia sp.]|nr:YraN family protein [Naasia sp.]
MAAKDDLGRRGEELAAGYLTARGYRIVDRNWRCSQGEIDLVARRGRGTVFVEVKTRSSLAYGHPFEAITEAKLGRLYRLARIWCREHPGRHGDIRVDVVAIVVPRVGSPVVEVFEDVR